MSEITNEHAKALSQLGAAKGGKTRAENLTSEERKEIARHAAEGTLGKRGPAKSNPRW